MKEIKSLLCGLADLRADDVDFAARLGKVGGNRPRLLKVGFKSQQQRNEILKKAKDVNAKQGDKKNGSTLILTCHNNSELKTKN